MKPLPFNTYQDVYKATGIDIDGRRRRLEDCGKAASSEIYTFIEFTKRLPGFSEINIEDQVTIIKGMIFNYLHTYKAWHTLLSNWRRGHRYDTIGK